MGQKRLPPPPPLPDPRLTPQSVHGNFPPLDRRELPLVPLEQRLTQAHQVKLARLIKQHRQEEQDIATAYNREMDRIAGESRPRSMDISTHSPGYILANSDSRRVNYGAWHFSWRHYAFFWIVIDIALTVIALYIGLSPKF